MENCKKFVAVTAAFFGLGIDKGRIRLLNERMANAGKVLIVDDDVHIANVCAHFLKQDGWETEIVHTSAECLDCLRSDKLIRVVFLDVRLPDGNGVDILRTIKEMRKGVEVVMVSAHGTIGNAVECMKLGAIDFIPKPFSKQNILSAVMRASRFGMVAGEVARLQTELRKKYRFTSIVGKSPKLKALFYLMDRAIESDSTMLILGESGVGKDLVARSIHYNSARAKGAFVPVNCAALPEELIESELFGYKKGAFTGAVSDAIGLFRTAEKGTIFLDEIAELPFPTQSKLLRVLQEKKIRPVGGTEEIPVDVRVMCASNRDIESAVAEGRFRNDLYYRIHVLTVTIPPLRERREDIPLMANHFIAKFNKEFKRSIKGIDRDAMSILLAYDWRGNVRELENAIESAFVMCAGENIGRNDLPLQIQRVPVEMRGVPDSEVIKLSEAERRLVRRALIEARGNKTEAAKMLGVTRKRLYNLIKRHKVYAGDGLVDESA